ncbi:MAG: anti-sigma factor RsbA family regulatory protein [Egibacteraceae bacterium]
MADNETRLVHQALLYKTEQEFVDAVVPFLREGIANGERVIAVTTPPHKLALIEEALDQDASFVESLGIAEFSDTPARRLAGFHAHIQGTRRLRAVGELPWSGSGREREEWARYESIVNVALASGDADLLCLYDAGNLEAAVLDIAMRTHPLLLHGPHRQPSHGYVDPGEFTRAYDAAPLLEPEGPTETLEFRSEPDLRAIRRLLRGHAARSGLIPGQIESLLVAASEVATNVLRHGGGCGIVRCWVEPDRFTCEIADPWGRITDPFAGFVPPAPDQTGGRGLWLVRQLCDAVEIPSRDIGTVVRLHVRRGRDRTV